MKLGVVDPIIGLDVLSGNSPINSERVENTPISSTNPQVPHHPDRNEGSFSRSHEWDKLIADKKSVMELILNQCDKATREEITLGQSPEHDMMAGGLLKFVKELRKVCTNSKGKDVFFGSSISKFTKHHIWPATRVEKLLATHPDNDCIWNNTDPCDVSLDDTSDSKGPVSLDVTKGPVKPTTTPMSIEIDNNSNATQD